MTLSQLCLILGVGMALSHLVVVLNPTAAGAWLVKFPRNVPLGVVFMLAGTLWFEWNVWNESLSDIAAWKNLMMVGFGAVGIGCCLFVRDYLAVRGLSVVMLMGAWYLCEKARWHDSAWRNAVTGLAYVWVFFAMWWSMAPWRLRDAISWLTRAPGRLQRAAAAGVVGGIFFGALGLTVLR